MIECPARDHEKRVTWILDNFGYRRFGELVSSRVKQYGKSGLLNAAADTAREIEALIVPAGADEFLVQFCRTTLDQIFDVVMQYMGRYDAPKQLTIEHVWGFIYEGVLAFSLVDDLDWRGNEKDDHFAALLVEFFALSVAVICVHDKEIRKSLGVKVPMLSR